MPPPSLIRYGPVRQVMGVAFVMSVSFNVLLSALPLWGVNRVLPSAFAGLPTTVMLMVTIAVQPCVPLLLKRLDVGTAQAVGLVMLGAPALLYYLSASLPLILVISGMRGVGFAIVTVAVTTLASSLVPPSRRSESVGLYGLATAVPAIAGTPIGVILTKAGHFDIVALMGAAPLLALPLVLMPGRGRSHSVLPSGTGENRAAGLATALACIWPPALCLFVGTIAAGGLTAYLPIALPGASLPLLLVGAGTALGRWRVRHLAARYGTRWLVLGCSLTMAAGVALVGVGVRSDWPLVITGAALFGLSLGAIQSLSMVAIFARAPAGFTAMASAAWNISFDAGTGVGAGLVGGLTGLGIGIPSAIMATAAPILASLPFTVSGAPGRSAVESSAERLS